MSSSDDTFGWSTTSDTMSSDEDKASQASSVLDRKLHKKQVRENLIKIESKSDEAETEFQLEEKTSKKKKKKKYEQDKNLTDIDNILTPDIVNIQLEPEDTPNVKPKTKKIKLEPDERETPVKKSKKSKNKSEPQESEDFVNQTDSNTASQKKKKKRKHSIDEEPEYYVTTNESFAVPPAKKRKNHNEFINKSDIVHIVQNDSQYQQMNNSCLIPENHHDSPKKKNSKCFLEDVEITPQTAREKIRKESVHFDDTKSIKDISRHKESLHTSSVNSSRCEDNLSITASPSHKDSIVPIRYNPKDSASTIGSGSRDISDSKIFSSSDVVNIKLEPEDTSNVKLKKMKIKLEPEEKETTENTTPVKKCKKSKNKSEPQESEDFQNTVNQTESNSTSKKKRKKRKRSIDEEPEKCVTPNDSFAVSPAKKRTKHSESINKSDIVDIVQNDSQYQQINGTTKESSLIPENHHDSPKKKKSISFIEDVELTPKTAREKIRKDSVHFDDAKNIKRNSRRKESLRTSLVQSPRCEDILPITASPSRKDSSTSIGSNRKDSVSTIGSRPRDISISSIASSNRSRSISASSIHSRKRSSSSSSSRSEPRKSNTPQKIQNRRKSSISDSRSHADREGRKSAPAASKVVETMKRSSLSERIRFEDDNNDSENESRSLGKGGTSQIDKFLNRNPKLKPVSAIELTEIINSDDEVWVLKCPKDYDHKKLKGMDFSVDDKIKIKLDGQTYDGIFEDDTYRIAVMYPSKDEKFEIRNVQPKGTLVFRKRIPKVHISEVNVAVPRETFIPLPETKRRHPLFGHDYRKFIKIPTFVSERLTETVHKKKLKSKRKYKEEKFLDSSSKDEVDSITQEEVLKRKKKMKHKLRCSESSQTDVEKFKHDPDAKVWDSEKGIERSLFKF